MNDDTLVALEPVSTALVPAPFAEKAMASLMQLHSELMEEKERRVDLYRRLMEKEQSLAELKMYVKLLEERLAVPGVGAKTAEAASSTARAAVPSAPHQGVAAPVARASASPSAAARTAAVPPPLPVAARAAASSTSAGSPGMVPPPAVTPTAAHAAAGAPAPIRTTTDPAVPRISVPPPPPPPAESLRARAAQSAARSAARAAAVTAQAVMRPGGQDARLDGWKSW